MPKKRRVPEVLWRLFRDRARSLACTIVSLLPPPPSLCLCCTGSQCLGCSGAEAMSFLMRDDDPLDYLKLLNQCFVVVSDNAPPLSLSYSHSRWPQPQVCIFLSIYDSTYIIHVYTHTHLYIYRAMD